MKRNYILLLVVVVLAALGYYYSQNKTKSTVSVPKASYDFTVKDTASITKITIEDKTPSKVELIRVGDKWMVDGEKLARKDAIEVLLETLHRMEMKNFVRDNAKKTVNKRIDVYGKEVKVFVGDEIVKHFFVGTETGNQMGTHMRMAGYKDPYAVHILGFNGFLNTRFFTTPSMWYDRTIWGYDNLEIASAGVNFPSTPDMSFKIQMEDGSPVLLDASGERIETNPVYLDQTAMAYFAAFRTASYEGAIIPSDKIFARRDSLRASVPFFEITATNKAGDSHTLTAYRIKAAEDTYNNDGTPALYDSDRLHAFIDNQELVLVQFHGLQHVLKGIDDFIE